MHDVLEHLYQLEPDERTSDVLRTLAGDRWKAGDWESAVEALDKKQGEIKDFKIQAFNCMQNLWRLEDPQHVDLMGMEHEVNVAVEGVQLRGFIDRVLIDDTGAVVIGDYKTGKVPNPRFTSEDTKFFQLLTYALMLRESDQEETSRVELLYLKDGVRHDVTVTPVKLAIAQGTIVETKEAIDAACDRGEFECNVTKLCDWCFFKPQCPAHQ